MLALKANQGTMHQDVVELFDDALVTGFADLEHDSHRSVEQQDRDGWNTASLGPFPTRPASPLSMRSRPGRGCAVLGWSRRNGVWASRCPPNGAIPS